MEMKIKLEPITMVEWTRLFLEEQWAERELAILRNHQLQDAIDSYRKAVRNAGHDASTASENLQVAFAYDKPFATGMVCTVNDIRNGCDMPLPWTNEYYRGGQ